MNLTYTERYLVSNISNKAFRLKYGERFKKKGQKQKKWQKWSKKERQQWWKSLTPDQQQEYIEKKQAQRTKERENRPLRPVRFNSKYPWLVDGVNEGNRAKWLKMIHKKNSWLKAG